MLNRICNIHWGECTHLNAGSQRIEPKTVGELAISANANDIVGQTIRRQSLYPLKLKEVCAGLAFASNNWPNPRVVPGSEVECNFANINPNTCRIMEPVGGKGYIPLDSSGMFRSDISINEMNVGDKGVFVNAVPGVGTPVNMTSTLSNYNNKTGGFSGTAVLVVALE